MRRLMVLGALLVLAICLGAAWYAVVEGFTPIDALPGGHDAFHGRVPGSPSPRPERAALHDGVHPRWRWSAVLHAHHDRRDHRRGATGGPVWPGATSTEGAQHGAAFRHLRIRPVGREVAEELSDRHEPYVIIDRDESTLAQVAGPDVGVVHGDATEEATLRAAGVEHARALIAAADSDVENTYIVLTARAINPQLVIVARAGTDSAEARMRSAGANRVVSPYRIGGRRMALSAAQPMLVEMFDTLVGQHGEPDGNMLCEILVDGPALALAGQTLAEAFPPSQGLQVMGIARTSGALEVGPRGAVRMEAGDRLMIYGEREAIARLSPEAVSARRR